MSICITDITVDIVDTISIDVDLVCAGGAECPTISIIDGGYETRVFESINGILDGGGE